MDSEAASIDRALRDAAVPERAERERAYLKSDLEHYGTSMPAIDGIVASFLAGHPDMARRDLLALVERLWSTGVHEARMAAVELLARRAGLLTPTDLPRVEHLLRESRTWALVDPLAVQVLGALVEAHPELATVFAAWVRDDDRWMRRSTLLAHLLPMRRGDPDVFERFARYADALLEDRDPFIRKAIGWVLRERTKRCPDEVFTWLLDRRERASGLTLREASKHLPEAQRARLRVGRGRSRES